MNPSVKDRVEGGGRNQREFYLSQTTQRLKETPSHTLRHSRKDRNCFRQSLSFRRHTKLGKHELFRERYERRSTHGRYSVDTTVLTLPGGLLLTGIGPLVGVETMGEEGFGVQLGVGLLRPV